MRILILVIHICLLLSVSTSPIEDRENGTEDAYLDDQLMISDLSYNDLTGDVSGKWFNFSLVYFYGVNKTIEITAIDQFFEIGLLYKRKYKTVFFIHGWQSEFSKEQWFDDLKDMVMDANDEKVNFFIVDWAKVAKSLFYSRSMNFTKILGSQLAGFIAFLKEQFSANMNEVHLIGHSLGAHAAGFTAKHLKKVNITLGKITGLDPAGPGFTTENINNRLDKTDAKLVEILHTNMGRSFTMGLGITLKIGHVDLFLNGGSRQKGCYAFAESSHDSYFPIKICHSDDPFCKTNYREHQVSRVLSCHHGRSVDFYTETGVATILPIYRAACQPLAYKCKSYRRFLDGKCTSCGKNNENCWLFGYSPAYDAIETPKENGSYFMLTNSRTPLCAYHYHVEFDIDSSNFEHGKFILQIEGEENTSKIELSGDWDGKIFSAVVTTDKSLGRLVEASGQFERHWFDNKKEAELVSLRMRYMSNIDQRTRDYLSASFIGTKDAQGEHHFYLEFESEN